MMSKENMKDKKAIVKKVLKITGNVLVYLLMAIAIFVLVISITSKKDSDGTATVFGYQLRFVQSDSMEECELTDVSKFEIKSIRVKSCVFVDVAPESEEEKAEWYKSLKVGDVLTFKYVYVKQETITHRIVGFSEDRSLIYLEGDNKDSDGDTLTQVIDVTAVATPNYVIGKVIGQSYLLGMFMRVINSPVGLICVVIIPSVLIILWEVLKIIRVLGADKRRAQEEEAARQQEEIEALKRRLEELEGKPTPEAPAADASGAQSENEANGNQP